MTDYSHILFNKSPLQLRLLGARGGKAFGRNQRLRRAPLPTPPPATAALPALPRHTTAEAISELDARSPWLRGAERRPGPGRRANAALRSFENVRPSVTGTAAEIFRAQAASSFRSTFPSRVSGSASIT
jgi:hypothetical protein